jgi:hypothetical protein
MTRAKTQFLAALFVCAILAAPAGPPLVAVAAEVGGNGLDGVERDQLRQQKAARDAEEEEARERAYERWLRKLEREVDSGAEEDSAFDSDGSFFKDLFEQD